MRVLLVPLACAICGCATQAPDATAPAPLSTPPAAPVAANLAPYLDTLGEIAAADPQRQAALLAELQALQVAAPGGRSTLRYALALGAAGREGSDPVEARRLISELVAIPQGLEPTEIRFAETMQREFDARVTLYAKLARQREDLERRVAVAAEANARSLQAASAELSRLRRELAQAETKLQAITEMERELLEQAAPVPPEDPR